MDAPVETRNLDAENKELRAQVAQLQQQLLSAQKLTSLGELVGTTTHEFNNVLMTILNYAKMGLRHQDSETRTRAFDKILAAATRAAKITNSVLGMARNRSSQFEPTNLQRIIDESMYLLERELQKYRISVELNVADVPPVLACGNQIQQILINLLTNARQAMGSGGRLIVGLSYDRENQTVDLSVRDFGPGIGPDKLPKIFEPYYSTKSGPDESGKGGTGLGLSACRQIVEAHHGKIRVESTVGQGTCFTIKLPVASPPTAAPFPKVAVGGTSPPTSAGVSGRSAC
jgi:signal transduction histidine kinase